MCILKIKDLTKKYGDFEILKGINLEISSPGIYALVGSNVDLEKIIFEDIEWSIDENRIKVNLKSKSINDLLKLLVDNDIRIVDIEKVKKGSEEKYIEMFPDEMDKIKGYV